MKRDYKVLLEYIRNSFRDYITKANLKSVVLGISGGIDSALVAAIVHPVCKEIKIPLIGVSLPSSSNKSDEIERANSVGKNFCDVFLTLNIDKYAFAFNYDLSPADRVLREEKIRQGNIKARIRMIVLYDIAQKNNGLVLGTDNLTEYYLGFWTLHGDVGDLGLIQNLWKTEVYELSKYILSLVVEIDKSEKFHAFKSCIEAIPTDGLGITSSDLEQIKAKSYDEVDIILKDWILNKKGDVNNPVIQRYERTHFKRKNPYNLEIK